MKKSNPEIALPRFSIIIPTYNNAKTLGDAIDSALSQMHPPAEVIVIDDGSTDETRSVVAQFDGRIQYFPQENSGPSAARNNGAQTASSEWLAFLDADDVYYPHRLKEHALWISREPDIDFLLGNQDFKDLSNRILYRLIEDCPNQNNFLKNESPEISLRPDDFGDLIANSFYEIRTLSIRRSRFLHLGGFPPDRRIGEDLHFFIRLCLESKKAGITRKSLAAYYIHEASALRKDLMGSRKKFLDTLTSLASELASAPQPLQRGFSERLRLARLSLAYAQLAAGEKVNAISSVLPLIFSSRPLRGLRDTISIVKGLPSPSKKSS